MNIDDIGDLSSFEEGPKEKGLLTFYQEQWALSEDMDTNEIDKNTDSEHFSETSKIINVRLFALKQIINKNEATHKPYNSLKHSQPTTKTESAAAQNSKPFNFIRKTKAQYSFSLHDMKRQKQNKIKLIERNLGQKIPLYPRTSNTRTYESVHIQTFPLTDKQNTKKQLSKLAGEMPSIRIRKGSSFKGFHRENVSISLTGLNKNVIFSSSKKDNSFQLSHKTLNHYQESLVQRQLSVSNYLFPVQNYEGYPFLGKKKSEKKVHEYKDSLNKLCKRFHRKEQKNTELAGKEMDYFGVNA